MYKEGWQVSPLSPNLCTLSENGKAGQVSPLRLQAVQVSPLQLLPNHWAFTFPTLVEVEGVGDSAARCSPR